MDDIALLTKYNLSDIKSLYKPANESHFQKYAVRSCSYNEDARKFSIGKDEPLQLYNISKKELKEPTFNKLDEDQKAGIMKLHGNPTKIKRICPFQTENEKLLVLTKSQVSKRMKSDIHQEMTFQRKLQQITVALKKKTWPQYNGENPFKPRLTKTFLKEYNMMNYCDYIEKPMSLSDVTKKVQDDMYDSLEDYEEDIKLIVNNAIRYHGETSTFADLGRDLLNVGVNNNSFISSFIF